jgi:hypothetical protein
MIATDHCQRNFNIEGEAEARLNFHAGDLQPQSSAWKFSRAGARGRLAPLTIYFKKKPEISLNC